jgi:hypothetical protein
VLEGGGKVLGRREDLWPGGRFVPRTWWSHRVPPGAPRDRRGAAARPARRHRSRSQPIRSRPRRSSTASSRS